MTPRKLEALGNKLLKHKKLLWIVVIGCLITSGSVAFFIYKFSIPEIPVFTMILPMYVLFLAWGLLMSIYWFSIEGKMNPAKIESYTGIKKSLNVFFSWYGAVFLSLWYLIVLFAVPIFAWRIFASGH